MGNEYDLYFGTANKITSYSCIHLKPVNDRSSIMKHTKINAE